MPRNSLHGEDQISNSKTGYEASQISRGPFRFTKIAAPKHKPKNHQYLSLQDLIAYLSCLMHFKSEFEGSQKPLWKAFKLMSALRPQLNPNQCRILHKKMLDEHKDIDGILFHFEDVIDVHSTSLLALRKQLREMEAVKIAQESELKPADQREVGINPAGNNFFWSFSNDFKQQKQDNIRTDVSYIREYQEEIANRESNKTCHYNGYMQPPIWLGASQSGREKQQQWRQCHSLFLAWVNKLHSLMQ